MCRSASGHIAPERALIPVSTSSSSNLPPLNPLNPTTPHHPLTVSIQSSFIRYLWRDVPLSMVIVWGTGHCEQPQWAQNTLPSRLPKQRHMGEPRQKTPATGTQTSPTGLPLLFFCLLSLSRLYPNTAVTLSRCVP